MNPELSHALLLYKIEDWRRIDRKNPKPLLAALVNESDNVVLNMILMGSPCDITLRSKKPHNYRTSIALVDKNGNTIFDARGIPKKRAICINKRVWKEYRKHNRDPQTNRTDCSALRAFLQRFPDATNESLCLLVERKNSGSVKEWHQLTLDEQQKILRQGDCIVLHPVQRKKPTRVIH
ncbi:hypothetical protein MUO74_02990 [Candidatus Bathyarchaeota archaeon]|nr:hypothetical protein [Candidatus Bathyarchaeota archaeon]